MQYSFKNIVILKAKKYYARVRFWIDENDGPFLGIGRVVLLENIKETGSIQNAAKNLKMSYRKAWQLVKDMNKRAESPLVEVKLGGAGGGGAAVTEKGEKLIKLFYNTEREINDYAKKKLKELTL